jgi:hypothetical protein
VPTRRSRTSHGVSPTRQSFKVNALASRRSTGSCPHCADCADRRFQPAAPCRSVRGNRRLNTRCHTTQPETAPGCCHRSVSSSPHRLRPGRRGGWVPRRPVRTVNVRRYSATDRDLRAGSPSGATAVSRMSQARKEITAPERSRYHRRNHHGPPHHRSQRSGGLSLEVVALIAAYQQHEA